MFGFRGLRTWEKPKGCDDIMNAIIEWIASNKLYLLLGLAGIFNYYWLIQFKKKLRINDLAGLLLGFLVIICSLLFAKFFAFLETGGEGMSLYGGVFFLPVAYYLGAKVTKRSTADVFDIFTICTIFTAMCARVNCLMAGCCLGKLFFGSEVLRWPTREMEIVLYIILLVWLGKKVGRAESKGKIYPMYMVAYGTFRFITEWLRVPDNPVYFLHRAHIWSVLAIVIGAIIYYRLNRKQKSGNKNCGAQIRKREEKT